MKRKVNRHFRVPPGFGYLTFSQLSAKMTLANILDPDLSIFCATSSLDFHFSDTDTPLICRSPGVHRILLQPDRRAAFHLHSALHPDCEEPQRPQQVPRQRRLQRRQQAERRTAEQEVSAGDEQGSHERPGHFEFMHGGSPSEIWRFVFGQPFIQWLGLTFCKLYNCTYPDVFQSNVF